MRVVHVITRLIVGGAQENTIATVLGLRVQHEVDATLISGPTTGPEGSLESEFATYPSALSVLPSLVRQPNPLLDIQALIGLWRQFRQSRPGIVHTHSAKAGILGRLAARMAKVPIIIHSIHGPSFGNFQGALANVGTRVPEYIAGSLTHQFVAVADAMSQQYIEAGIGHSGNHSTIYSGFNLEPFLQASNSERLRTSLGISPNDFVIGKVARLFRLKGHDDLMDVAPEIVRKVPNIKFLMVGDGLWMDRLKHRAREQNVEKNFVFTGLVPPKSVPSYIGIMDALIHLSYREGLPRALPQALAAGKPIIAYDCDGAREVCINNETGFLIGLGMKNELAPSIAKLASSAELKHQLGINGQNLVKERFSTETMVRRIHELYEFLLAKHTTQSIER
jgi:glycosyltransferase involved in cell wall biosynthesis